MKNNIDAEKLIAEIDSRMEDCKLPDGRFPTTTNIVRYEELSCLRNFITSFQQEQDMGEVSDGYHTFNELYYYRMLYNAAFFNLLPKEWVHKSKRHYTGEECFGGGWFIVIANLPTGQVSNHYELKDWDLFKVPEKEFADGWDGHTPQEAADRLRKYLQQEQPDNMIQWTGNNLKEVIDFTGKSPKFGEWFKSWDEFESYVHSHGDILKLFSEDGSHFEVPVGAWIVKTPDGHNVPSVARFIHAKQEHPDYKEAVQLVFEEKLMPFKDGNQWCFLLGRNIQEGICGFGDTILDAAVAFYKDYTNTRIHIGELKISMNQQDYPEVGLEKEYKTWWNSIAGKINVEHMMEWYMHETARHFYELGKNARKEE